MILETYYVASASVDPNVLDGYSMSFQVKFTDGRKIEAFAKISFENVADVFSELNDLTAEARNKFGEEKRLMQCF